MRERREILDAAWEVARDQGLGGMTLRDVAGRVGMQPPSLYTHFASKQAVYDAMFGQAWQCYLEIVDAIEPQLPGAPRAALLTIAEHFVDFAVRDPARHQLMNQRTLPGFEPSAESYTPAVRVLERLEAWLHRVGVRDEAGADLFTALLSGLIDQQLANDPGGTRWSRLLHRVIDMYADEMGLPGPRLRQVADGISTRRTG